MVRFPDPKIDVTYNAKVKTNRQPRGLKLDTVTTAPQRRRITMIIYPNLS
jgi:hypothetical protein